MDVLVDASDVCEASGTCVLDELHVFAHNVPTFLNAVQYFFTSTHT